MNKFSEIKKESLIIIDTCIFMVGIEKLGLDKADKIDWSMPRVVCIAKQGDVSNIGHWETGDVELSIKNNEDLMKAQTFISLAYNEN